MCSGPLFGRTHGLWATALRVALALVKFCIRTCGNALSGVRQWLLKVPEVILPEKQVRCLGFSCSVLEPRSRRSCLHVRWWHLLPEVWSQARNRSFLREHKLLSLSIAFLLESFPCIILFPCLHLSFISAFYVFVSFGGSFVCDW